MVDLFRLRFGENYNQNKMPQILEPFPRKMEKW